MKAALRRHPDLILLILLGLATAPLVFRYFGRLWGEEQYQYFPVLLGVMAYLGWSRWQEAPMATRPLRWPWVVLLAIPMILLLVIAILYQVPVLAALGLTLGLGGVAVCVASERKVENLVGLWVLCWLLIRPPWGYDEKLMGWLQGVTTSVASRLLDLFGSMHLTEGNVLTYPGKTFFVDEACSGIISLRTMLAATVVIAVYRNRPLMHALVLVAAGLFWAGVMNVIRIGVIAVAYLKFGIDLTEGWPHDLTGVLVFLLAVGGVMSTDAYLEFFLGFIRTGVYGTRNWLVNGWNRLIGIGQVRLQAGDFEVKEKLPVAKRRLPLKVRWGLGVMLGGLVLLQSFAFLPMASRAENAPVNRAAVEPSEMFAMETIQPKNPKWKVVDFDQKARNSRSVWGENSLVWTYGDGEIRATFSLDYFFRKWHELTVCYRSSGWQLDERVILSDEDEGGKWATVRARCSRPASREQGLFFFDLFRTSGAVLDPVESVMAADWKERFSLRNMNLFKGAFVDTRALDVCQVQVFVVSDVKLTGARLKDIHEEYEHFRDQIYKRLMGGLAHHD